MTTWRPLVPFVATLAAASPALAGHRPPTFDIAATCQSAKEFATGARRKKDYAGCLAQERRAKASLTARWSKFPARDKRECDVGGPDPSYVELQTCLQMSTFKLIDGAEVSRIGGPMAKGLPPGK